MVEIRDVIDTLKGLQAVDRKLAHLARMKDLEPKRLAKAETAVAKASDLMAQLDTDHLELQRKISRVELDIKAREEKTAKHKSQMLSASTNKEYQALIREISLEDVEKAKVEEQLLEEMIQIEDFTEREKEAAVAIEKAAAELLEVAAEVKASLKQVAAEESGIQHERDAIAAELPKAILRQYERLFESRAGNAIVSVSYIAGMGRAEGRYSCTGCNMSLTHQMVNLLLIGSEIVHCKSCGRILFMDEDAKEEA